MNLEQVQEYIESILCQSDKPGEVLTQLITRKQGSRTADEFIVDFKIDAL